MSAVGEEDKGLRGREHEPGLAQGRPKVLTVLVPSHSLLPPDRDPSYRGAGGSDPEKGDGVFRGGGQGRLKGGEGEEEGGHQDRSRQPRGSLARRERRPVWLTGSGPLVACPPPACLWPNVPTRLLHVSVPGFLG